MTFWEKHVGFQTKSACGKPETLYVGLAVTKIYTNDIDTNEYTIHSNSYELTYPIGIAQTNYIALVIVSSWGE